MKQGGVAESCVPGADSADAALPHVEPSKLLRWDAAAICAAIEAKKTAESLTWNDVADRVGGVAAASVTRLAKGGRVAFPDLMCGWLDRPAANFTRSSAW